MVGKLDSHRGPLRVDRRRSWVSKFHTYQCINWNINFKAKVPNIIGTFQENLRNLRSWCNIGITIAISVVLGFSSFITRSK